MDTVMLKGKRKTIRIHNKTKHTKNNVFRFVFTNLCRDS